MDGECINCGETGNWCACEPAPPPLRRRTPSRLIGLVKAAFARENHYMLFFDKLFLVTAWRISGGIKHSTMIAFSWHELRYLIDVEGYIDRRANQVMALLDKSCGEMTESERANLDRLYKEFEQGRKEDGGNWPEYSGPGR